MALALALGSHSVTAVDAGVVAEIRFILERESLHGGRLQDLQAPDDDALAVALRALDPWAERIPPGRSEQDAARAVIGAELYRQDDGYWLLPYMDGPLAQAGISTRMALREIDGRTISDQTQEEVAGLLQDESRDTVVLGLCRPPCENLERVKVVRQRFRPASVEPLNWHGRPLLRIRRFVASESRPFLRAVVQAGDASDPLVIDLRDCQGGDLFEALDTAALFLPPDTHLLTTIDRHGGRRIHRSPAGSKMNQPLRLLVGPATASAAELFAGILQKAGRAEVIGAATRGKCVSQKRIRLSDGSDLLFTNLATEFADGTSCEGRGIAPDRVVDSDSVADTGALLGRLDR